MSNLQPGRYGWYVAAVLALAHLVSMIDRFAMGVLLVPIKIAMNLSDTELAVLHGLGFVILYCLIGIPMGLAADRVNRRKLVTIGVLFWSIAAACCGLASSFSQLFMARVAIGLGEACLVPAAMSLIAAYFAADRLGRATAIFTAGAAMGHATAFLAGGTLLAFLTARGGLDVPGLGALAPWQGTFLLMSLPGFVVAGLALSIKEPPRVANDPRRPGSLSAGLTHVRRHARAYVLHTGTFTALIAIIHIVAAWTVSFYARKHSVPVRDAAVFVGITQLTAAPVGHVLGGWVFDQLRRRGTTGAPGLAVAASLALVAISATVFLKSESSQFADVGYVALLFCIGLGCAPGYAGLQLLTPESHRGVVTGTFVCVYTLIALGLAPLSVGLLSDFVFEDSLGDAVLTGILTLASAGIVMGVASRRPYQRSVSGLTGMSAQLEPATARTSR